MLLVLPDSKEIGQKQFYFIFNVSDDRQNRMLKSNSSPIDDAIRNYCNARNLSAAVVFFSKV